MWYTINEHRTNLVLVVQQVFQREVYVEDFARIAETQANVALWLDAIDY